MSPRGALLLAGAGVALAAPPGASAASVAFDRACYVSGQAGAVVLAGFAPGAAVTVSSPALGSTSVTTDGAGAARVGITPPSGDDLPGPGSRAVTVTATQDPAVRAEATARYAPLAFRTAGGTTTPTAARRWSFSGWNPGLPLYAHFRLGGRTRGTHRFGVAAGPCGELRQRAPAIVSRGGVRPGAWAVVVDQRPAFSPLTRPQLEVTTPVYPTWRSRVPGAVGLVVVAPGDLPRYP